MRATRPARGSCSTRANTEHPDDADVLEGLGRAAYLDLDFQAAIEHWQRAYAGLFLLPDASRGPPLQEPVYEPIYNDLPAVEEEDVVYQPF